MTTTAAPGDPKLPGDLPVELHERRIRDLEAGAHPDVDLAHSLLASARPYEATAAQRQRVWAAIGRRPRQGAGALLLRPAVVFTVLLGFVAVAAASLGQHFVARMLGRSAPVRVEPGVAAGHAQAVSGVRDTATRHAPAAAPGVAPAAAVALPPPAETPGAPLRPRTVTAPPTTILLRAPSPPSGPLPAMGSSSAPASLGLAPVEDAPRAPAPGSSAPGSRLDLARSVVARGALGPELTLMEDAVYALRESRDYPRASSRFDEYLRLYPHGIFVEDAMAYGIEAASERGDDGGAAALGARYLVRFPSGRFVEVARRAVSRPAP